MRPRTRIDPAEVRECHAAGMKDAAVARLLGCTPWGVTYCRQRLGLPRVPGRNKVWTPADTGRLQSLHAAGRTLPEIAETLGRTVLSVRDRLRILKREPL